MSSSDEYGWLVGKQNSLREDEMRCREKIRKLNYEIDYLKHVKHRLDRAEDSIKYIKNKTKRTLNNGYEWRGDSYRKFNNIGSELLAANNIYWRNADYARDRICEEITRLENERNQQYGILGHLISMINSIANEIEMMLNNF